MRHYAVLFTPPTTESVQSTDNLSRVFRNKARDSSWSRYWDWALTPNHVRLCVMEGAFLVEDKEVAETVAGVLRGYFLSRPVKIVERSGSLEAPYWKGQGGS
jgi:hypothetical protein